MNYGLPVTAVVNGEEYDIRSDWRAILDIITAIDDPDLSEQEKVYTALFIFYRDFESIPIEDYQEAMIQLFSFIALGESEEELKKEKKKPKLVDWEQDFNLIIGQINKVAGKEIRALEYLHWWTFISYYNEIDGDSTFARVVGIRDKKARGKKLDKEERAWYNRNRQLIDLKVRYSDEEKDALALWTGQNG